MSSSVTGGMTTGQVPGHDDPTHENQIVAVYATEGEAQAAKAALISGGVPASAVQVTSRDPGQEAADSDTAIPGSTDSGLWGAIRSLFVPDEDRNSYSHAVVHGHAVLVVTLTAGMDRSGVVHRLEGTNPVDFDAKLEEWRTSGYDYSQPHEHYAATSQAAGGAAPVGFASGTGGSTTGPVGGGVAGDTMAATAPTGMPGVGRREAPNGGARVRSYVMDRPDGTPSAGSSS